MVVEGKEREEKKEKDAEGAIEGETREGVGEYKVAENEGDDRNEEEEEGEERVVEEVEEEPGRGELQEVEDLGERRHDDCAKTSASQHEEILANF